MERLLQWESAISKIWELDGVGPGTLADCIHTLSRDCSDAQEEVERLRVCGNCGHIYEDESGASIGFLFCGELAVSPWSRVCQYVPSRWTAREEGGDDNS